LPVSSYQIIICLSLEGAPSEFQSSYRLQSVGTHSALVLHCLLLSPGAYKDLFVLHEELQPLAPLITVNVTNVLDSSCRSSYQHLFACRWKESLLNFSPILDLNSSHMKVVAICVLHFLLLYSSVSVSKD
jgi:hypothetical protein